MFKVDTADKDALAGMGEKERNDYFNSIDKQNKKVSKKIEKTLEKLEKNPTKYSFNPEINKDNRLNNVYMYRMAQASGCPRFKKYLLRNTSLIEDVVKNEIVIKQNLSNGIAVFNDNMEVTVENLKEENSHCYRRIEKKALEAKKRIQENESKNVIEKVSKNTKKQNINNKQELNDEELGV
jgi:Txe/YoeB family toxin of Txe-Axe toxin-antitoxin module